jgi:hypothetical protein
MPAEAMSGAVMPRSDISSASFEARTARGRSGPGGRVLRTCGASVESGILTFKRLVSKGSSRLASDVGSSLSSALISQ